MYCLNMIKTGLFFILLLHELNICNGHGYMWDPPGRSTAWRRNFPTPINYDDNGINCGSFAVQWYTNNGKCGPCGDNYALPKPRPNEYGGKYGLGIIVRKYKKNQDIPITLNITANHGGWFEFRLCSDYKTSTNECFNKTVLVLADNPKETKYNLDRRIRSVEVKYALPKGFTCNHCVLQWFWMTASNWSPPQEQFKNCADISIL